MNEGILLSVVIPAFNEEKRVAKTIKKIKGYLENQGYGYEILIVDDGSLDSTVELVKEISKESSSVRMLNNKTNCGKGYSIKKGFLNAKGRYLLFADADLSTPIKEIEKLLKWLNNGYDIAIGSRGLKESDIQIHQPWHRETMGRVFNLIVKTLILRGINDTQCGFKCFKSEVANQIFTKQKISGFAFDVESLFIARKMGYIIKEVPVQWLNSPGTRVSIARDSIRMFLDVFRIRYFSLRGLYK